MSTESITVGGLDRSYYLVRPKTIPAGSQLPMVVILHGINASISLASHRTGFLPLAADGAAILLYPVGYHEAWNAGSCCTNNGAPPNINDVAFIADVVRQVTADQPVDAKEVYVTGYSNGGKMSYRVACFESSLFAGFGAGQAVANSSCVSARPEDFVLVDSTGDPESQHNSSQPPIVQSGFTELSVPAQIAKFVSLDHCAGEPTTTKIGEFTLESWTGCAGGTHVELADISGGSHAWPDGSQPGTPSAEEIMWSFWTGQPFP
ncbi:MAG: alpha/beta hydrolase family esterase [Acidimicrobiales bacterium]